MNTKEQNPIPAVFALIFIFADLFVYYQIISAGGKIFSTAPPVPREYFLDVGAGDSELAIFPGNIKVLVDAGPTDAVLAALAKILRSGDDYIDLAIISAPQPADFSGYNFILDHYRVGAFVYNGRTADPPNAGWDEVMGKIKQKGIPLVTLGAGDKIHFAAASGGGGGSDEIDIFSPGAMFAASTAISDTGLVEMIKMPGLRTLLAADVGPNVQDWLAKQNAAHSELRADVIKLPAHAAKDSLSEEFLRAIAPKIAVIETGGKAKSAQPATSTLAQFAAVTTSAAAARIVRTDKQGTIEIFSASGTLHVF